MTRLHRGPDTAHQRCTYAPDTCHRRLCAEELRSIDNFHSHCIKPQTISLVSPPVSEKIPDICLLCSVSLSICMFINCLFVCFSLIIYAVCILYRHYASISILCLWFPSVLWHCWFGHLACKNRPRNDLLCFKWDVKPYTLSHSICFLLIIRAQWDIDFINSLKMAQNLDIMVVWHQKG